MRKKSKLLFDWDEGNSTKSWFKHRVSKEEQEESFHDKNSSIIQDKKHSLIEKRFLHLGQTKKKRKLLIAFTIRKVDGKMKIRLISARPMNKKEVRLYEETTKMA